MPALRDLTGQKFGRLTAITPTDQRKSGCVVWECDCECGNKTYVALRDLKSGNTKSCGCLNKDKKIERIQQYNRENKKYHVGDKIGVLTLLEETNRRSDTYIIWQVKCECGKIFDMATDILSSSAHSHCIHEPYQIGPKNDLTGQKFGKLTVLRPTQERYHGCVVWECRCDCGNICYKSTGVLTSFESQSCGCLKSQGEEKIIKILQENNITFETQKKFNDCKRNEHYLYFDFYINNLYLLEYDGIQHFEQTGFEDLKIIQERDQFKNNYCKINNIHLIRIPYTELKKLKIEDLQLETSKFIVV